MQILKCHSFSHGMRENGFPKFEPKTENRKSGCEPINKPCLTNIIDEDPLLIPIPPISARSNSSAKKTVGSFQTTSKGGSDTKSDLNTNKDGIGGISHYAIIIFS